MRRRMLRPEVQHERLPRCSPAEMTSSSLTAKILPQRVKVESSGNKQRRQIRMPQKSDPEKIMRLALVPVRPGKDLRNGGNLRGLPRDPGP
jgi:hypothetical protein